MLWQAQGKLNNHLQPSRLYGIPMQRGNRLLSIQYAKW